MSNYIKFALKGKMKDVHHVSTTSVGTGYIENKSKAIFTEDTVDIGQKSDNFYLQTKLEGEKVVLEGRAKGLTVNIYRVGNITFDSDKGIFQANIESNAFYQRIKSFINLSIIPQGFGEADLSYVDGVSSAILSLFDLKELENNIFHIENPQKADLSKLMTSDALGLNIQTLEMPLVIDYLLEHYDHEGFREYIENLMVHMGFMAEEDMKKVTYTITLCEKTDFILDRTGYRWPSLDIQSLKKMLYEALKDRISVLKTCHVFEGLGTEELASVAGRVCQEYYPDSSDILLEDQMNDNFYVIARGAVSVSCTSGSGWIGTVSILGEGNIMGEDSIFEDARAGILAESVMGDVLLFRFKNKDIRNLMDRIPQIGSSLIRELTGKLANLRKIIVTIG